MEDQPGNTGSQNGKEDNLAHYVKLFIHWDDSFWNASYVFLIIQAALIAALTQIPSLTKDKMWLLFMSFFAIFGIIVSILNFFVLNRKITYTHGCEELLRNIYFFDLYKKIEDRQTEMKKYSSAKIMHSYLPGVLCLFWCVVFSCSLVGFFGWIFT